MKKLALLQALAVLADDDEVKTADADITGVEIREDDGIYAVVVTGSQTRAALEQIVSQKVREIDELTAGVIAAQTSIDAANAEKDAAQRLLDTTAPAKI